MKDSILLVDDDSDGLFALSKALATRLPAVNIFTTHNPEKVAQIIKSKNPLAVTLDLCLDGRNSIQSGLSILQEIQSLDPSIRVLVVTGHSSQESGLECIRKGAANFLAKPVNVEHLSVLLQDAMEQTRLRRELNNNRKALLANSTMSLIGKSKAMNELREQLCFCAASKLPVLITGETGTGKGVSARLIHNLSSRSNSEFVRYQANFVGAEMVHSDLFGHEKGSFTGALQNRKGLIETANRGTLFIDEVDTLPLESQISLLGVLQENTYRPLGSTSELSSDFRLITACNGSISKALEQKTLRGDFYHRIAHIEVNVPALRGRKEDIPLLANYFLQMSAEKNHYSVFSISDKAYSLLDSYLWPGNVRELQAVIEAAVVKAAFNKRSTIEVSDISLKKSIFDQEEDLAGQSLVDRVNAFKKKTVQETLAAFDNNQVQTAKKLGVDRSTVRRILEGE